jgi:hypothetical protein
VASVQAGSKGRNRSVHPLLRVLFCLDLATAIGENSIQGSLILYTEETDNLSVKSVQGGSSKRALLMEVQ